MTTFDKDAAKELIARHDDFGLNPHSAVHQLSEMLWAAMDTLEAAEKERDLANKWASDLVPRAWFDEQVERAEKAEAQLAAVSKYVGERSEHYYREAIDKAEALAARYRAALEFASRDLFYSDCDAGVERVRAALSDTEEAPSVEPMAIRDNPELEAQLIRDHAEEQETDKTEENPLVTAAGQVC